MIIFRVIPALIARDWLIASYLLALAIFAYIAMRILPRPPSEPKS